MNRDIKKTLAYVAVALVMASVALYARYDRSSRPEVFDDQGKKFFDDFDPNTCTSLEVIDYDPAIASVLPFKVSLKDGNWVIPSHHDYPADARQRLVDTATGVIGLTKDSIRSDRSEDHEAFGVIDPLDVKATTLRGIGKRVTLRDVTDKVLADFIIGNEVKDHPDQRYVRDPRLKRTYGVKVKADLSTRFADWIETNLLKLDATRVRKVVIDHKSFDLENRQVIPGDSITLERKDANSTWTVSDTPPDKEPNTETLLAMSKALGDLKIAGIRPKPEGLTDDLKQAPGEIKPKTQEALVSLVRKGFFPLSAGMLSSKGIVTVTTDEGIVYTLRFGEVLIAAGNELSAGTEPSKSAKALEKAAGKPSDESSEGRYLFVTAAFDPDLLPPPPPPTEDDKFPDDPFSYGEGENKLLPVSSAARAKAEKLQKDRDDAIAEGKKRAKELSDRFAAWYYVTPGDSYKTIVLDRPNLIRDKSAKPANPRPGPGGFPPGFNPANLGQPFPPGN
jgi:Domain of unknown function (DUF4340)